MERLDGIGRFPEAVYYNRRFRGAVWEAATDYAVAGARGAPFDGTA
jgi:hypothetical protein